MKCEACGGDGLIEVGAYRGDENDTDTRECRLCGGIVTGTWTTTAVRAAEGLRALGQAGITLKESTSGVRRTVTIIEDPARTGLQFFGPYAGKYIIGDNEDAQGWAKRTAHEYNERLRRENEHFQLEVEQKELRRKQIETELSLLAAQRGTYIAKGTEGTADRYEQDLRRELEKYQRYNERSDS